jgi:hypothetical protein
MRILMHQVTFLKHLSSLMISMVRLKLVRMWEQVPPMYRMHHLMISKVPLSWCHVPLVPSPRRRKVHLVELKKSTAKTLRAWLWTYVVNLFGELEMWTSAVNVVNLWCIWTYVSFYFYGFELIVSVKI